MMAFSYRRLLIPLEKTETDNTSSCYMCYVCPDYCTNINLLPPPPPPPPSSSQGHQVSTVLVVMLCILGFALMFLSYLTIRGYRIRSRRNTQSSPPSDRFRDDENQGPVLDHPIWYIRTIGFPQSVIDTIAVFKYEKGAGLIEGSDCSICLNEFREDESLRLLPKCSHAFHLPCIDTWLRSHKNCPVCRAPVMNNNNYTNNPSTVVDISTDTSNRDHNGEMDDQIHESGDHRRNGSEEYSVHDYPARETSNLSDVVLRIDEDGTKLKNRVLSDLADHHHRHVQANQELIPLRRSVSMDFFSNNPTIHHPYMDHSYCMEQDEAGCSDFAKLGVTLVEKQHNSLDITDRKRLNNSKKPSLTKCSSHGLSIPNGPILMKRSFSFNGRRSLWRHSRSVESISIPEV